MSGLVDFFSDEGKQRHALENIADVFVEDELRIYDWTLEAFYSNLPIETRSQSFRKIYNELSGRWQVFRSNRSDVKYWTPSQCFDNINLNFAAYRMDGPINLVNFVDTVQGVALENALGTMRNIKQNKDYPWMTVSKFLHFFNPSLFPIYDTEYIFNRVFKCFGSDFREFCTLKGIDHRRSMSETTHRFLMDYMGWAHFLLTSAHPRFMLVFSEWLGQACPALVNPAVDPQKLYARAFEYTALGAASVVCPQLVRV